MTVRKGGYAAMMYLLLICLGCGDTFRPVAVPIIEPPPDPKAFHYSLVLSQNGQFNNGAGSIVDVAGDTVIGQAGLGLRPVHAAILPNGTKVYVLNSPSSAGQNDTVSFFSPLVPSSVSTISLPAGSSPSFIHTTTNDTIYVANSGNATVSAIQTSTNLVVKTIAVGANPIAEAETPDGSKLYVANHDDSTVTVINTVDKSVGATLADATIDQPVWAAARSDSARAYVLSQGNGDLATIDTFTSTLVPNLVSAGAGANFMFYDKRLNRLYITNPTAASVSVVDVSVDTPILLSTVPISAAPVTADHPCTTAAVPVSLTVLPDGSRAYVASYQIDGTLICSQVSVINSLTNTVTKIIPLDSVTIDAVNPTGCSTARFRLSMAASGDDSRVFMSNCDARNTAVMNTLDDTFTVDLAAPVSAFPPDAPGAQPPPQNPVFILQGP